MNPRRGDEMTMLKGWHASWFRFTAVVVLVGALSILMAVAPVPLAAQSAPAPRASQTPAPTAAALSPVPADYVIGPEDVLTVTFRYDPDMSGEVVVRPDGKISVPIVKDVVAAGLTIEELRVKLSAAAAPYINGDPAVSVQSKQINSRKVSILGEVNKQGPVPHLGPMTVLQLIALAGGLTVYADQTKILIIRTVNGKQTSWIFNFEEVKKGRKLDQNIQLLPGDQVIVP